MTLRWFVDIFYTHKATKQRRNTGRTGATASANPISLAHRPPRHQASACIANAPESPEEADSKRRNSGEGEGAVTANRNFKRNKILREENLTSPFGKRRRISLLRRPREA